MGRRKLVALALALCALALSPVVPGTDAACTLAPNLADWTVSQGVGSYTPLAHGKEAGVRLYLTLPSCAARRDQIQLVGASLSVSGGTPGEVTAPTPPISTTAPPTLGPLPAVDDSPSHPYFVVPASMLQRSDGAAFTAGFTATITYRSKAANASTFSAPQTITLPVAGTPAMTASVARRANGLRVLVVPMGDLAAGYDAQFPPAAVTATQNAMKNVARQLPVNGEVGDLVDGAGAGLRYRINSGMLDLGPNGTVQAMNAATGQRYCGSGSTWTAVKSQLSSFLQAWNTANPSATADRVVGAIWQDNAVSVTEGAGCDEGIATIDGREAWFRVSENLAGAVAGMEVLHTLGGAVGDHADFGYHSKNVDADVSDPGRAFNLLLRDYLADPRSTMRLSDTLWTESNTVYEPPDFELARCRLDDVPTGGTSCPNGAEVGQAVSAGNVFSISGTVGASGTPVDLHSYFMPGSVERTETDPASRFEVVQLGSDGTTVVQRDRIPARSQGTAHEPGHSDDHAHDGDVVIDASVPAHTNAEIFEVRRDGASIYRRTRGTAPTISVTTGTGASGARSWTADPTQADAAPSLSPDGALLAWIDGAGIRVRDVAKALQKSAAIRGTSPSLSGSSLAFVRDGNVYTAPVTVSSTAVTVGEKTLVYLAADPLLTGASNVTWGEGGSLVAEIAGDLFEITPSIIPGTSVTCSLAGALLGCARVATTPGVAETNPSVSPTGALAYERGGHIWVDGADTGIAGADPSWAGPLLTFVSGGSILGVPAGDLDATPKVLVAGDQPAGDGAGSLLAFHRADGDVWLADLGDDGDLTIVAEDTDPENLRVDVLLLCEETQPPVVVAAKPTSVSGSTATFQVTIDTSPACAGSMARIRVTDGWFWTTQDTGPYGDQGAPIPAIAAPLPGDVLRQWDSIPVAGSAVDETSDTTLSWELVEPDGTAQAIGTGQTLQDLAPPSGGWPTGTYRLRLTARDAAGNAASTEVAFLIVADEDNDGMTDAEENAASCFAADRNDDPTNAYDDSDKDGIVNVDDAEPCASAANVTTDFEPNTLNLGSTGVPVTIRLSAPPAGASMSGVEPSSVRITRIGGKSVNIPAQTWSVSGGVGTGQFDRRAVNNAVRSIGITGGYVAIVVEATSGSTALHGVDPSAPVVNNP